MTSQAPQPMPYHIGHISWSACHVQDLDSLVHLESDKLVDQGLGITVGHELLAVVEVLQVLKISKIEIHKIESRLFRGTLFKKILLAKF